MSFKKNIALILLSIVSLGLLFGCNDTNNSSDESGNSNGSNNYPQGANVGGGALGGTFYVWATGFGTLLSDNLGIQTNVEVSAGPVANFQLIETGDVDFGLVTVGPAWEGINGEGWAEGNKHENVRTLFPAFPSYMHWVTNNKNIRSIEDFADKSVNLGASGTTSEVYGRRILELLNIEPNRISNSSFSDANDQMRDGMVDVSVVVGGLPFPSVAEFTETEDAFVGGFSEEVIDEITSEYPYFEATSISGETYQNQEDDVSTIEMWNVMMGRADLDEDFVYDLVKETFDHVEMLTEVHPSAVNIQLENVLKVTSIPLHSGAIRYYEEMGVELPDSAYPEEFEK